MEQRKLNPFVNPLTDEGYVGYCQKKWTPLMESSWSPSKQRTMALLFENQARSSEGQLKKLQEDSTTTGDLATYVKYLFPTVRRVWPTLIANDIVSVQPGLSWAAKRVTSLLINFVNCWNPEYAIA
ncbi:hypothetical protein HZA73_07105 [candidate division TA06 bacterium]|nr:hypothetical protein [candidate division TA06 bacterium]